jgi:aryl-alcohol dehydrogenase-like predicted oxidoreductase
MVETNMEKDMQYRELGQSGINASVVAFGAWAIGGWFWGGADEEDAVAAIHAALDNGVNLLDTAPIYGMGHSERVVGRAIRGRRDKVVLATKCGIVWDGSNKGQGEFHFATDEKTKRDDGPIKVYRYLRPESIRREVEQSLDRLGTDYIDLLQTHWQDGTTPIAETMDCLMELKREGKIRAIGCSNATPAHMDAYRAAGRLDVDQEQYSMLDRKHETANLPYCATNAISFLAYSPLSQGLLTGGLGPDRVFAPGDQRIDKPRFSIENRRRVLDMLETYRPLTETYQCTLGQLVIAWTVAQPGCTHVLCGARTPGQVLENLKGGNIALSAADSAFMRDMVMKHAAGL